MRGGLSNTHSLQIRLGPLPARWAERRERLCRVRPRRFRFRSDDLAAVPFDELLGDEQADAGAHGVAGRKECVEDPGKNFRRDPKAFILDGQNNSIQWAHRIVHGY